MKIWGKVETHTNGELDNMLYHCEMDNSLLDVTVDTNGNIMQVAPSVISKDGNLLDNTEEVTEL